MLSLNNSLGFIIEFHQYAVSALTPNQKMDSKEKGCSGGGDHSSQDYYCTSEPGLWHCIF
jgi:hypothetical protein